jgi:hypothetical protein
MEKIRKTNQAVIASLLKNQAEARVLVLIGILHLILASVGFSGWSCPILLATGVPCPGCGVTRASAALLKGDWRNMASLHIFAPVLLAVLVLSGFIAFLPDELRARVIDRIELIELRTNLSLIFLLSLFLYWGLRLILDPHGYIALMASNL